MISNFTQWVEAKKGRCWDGYEPVPGKKPYSDGSCRPKKSKSKKKNENFGSFDTQVHPEEMGGEMDAQAAQGPSNEIGLLDQIGQMCVVQDGMSDTLKHTLNQIAGQIDIAKQQINSSF